MGSRRNGSRLWTWPIRIGCLTALFLVVYLSIFYHSSLKTRSYPHEISKQISPPPYDHSLDAQITHLKEIAEWRKPEGMKVVGLIFYGRRRFVSILRCYLDVCLAND